MNTFFIVLAMQIGLGALDNLWHHELREKLPARRGARKELALHGARELLYGAIFVGLAWFEWHGVWALLLGAALIIEIIITIIDFLVEDRTRRLPPSERVLHTVLAINAGALLALLVPTLALWFDQDSRLQAVHYPVWSWLLSAAAIGVAAWGARNLVSVVRLGQPPEWQRQPMTIGERADPRLVLVTGATGFIGRRLIRALLGAGDRAIVLSRDGERAYDCFGDSVRIITSLDEIEADETIDAIVNLAGAPVANWPWTRRRRNVLLRSRLATTRSLIGLIARIAVKPEVLVSASAIGYYGVRGDTVLVESSPRGTGFQANLCGLWERMARRAEHHGVRVVQLRIGLVLGRDGGILPRLTQSMRFGIGVVLGSGRQWAPWIHIADLVRLIQHAIDHPAVRGAVNGVTLHPVRHERLVKSAASALGCRWAIRIPAAPLRLLLGEMAELLVDGQRVIPSVAIDGYRLQYPRLEAALDEQLAADSREPTTEQAEAY